MTVKVVKGSSGSDLITPTYVPVESENSVEANTYARLLDLLCEGEIDGPAVDGDWYRSTYLNEIQVQNADGSLNFGGVTIAGRTGTPSQQAIADGVRGIELTEAVMVPVTVAGGKVSRTITDSDVDSVKIVISIPTMLKQSYNGDISATGLEFNIYVTPEGGDGVQQLVTSPKLWRKHTSEYRHQYRLNTLSQYGAAPWVISLERVTPDSSSIKLQDSFSWYSYTTVIETKLNYYDRAMVGLTLNRQAFGTNIPSRAYRVNGRKIKIPSNYDPVNRLYTGDWDGTFAIACSNNPAWIIYDMLTDPDAGLGLVISEDMVDKWSLYSCGAYCDETIVTTKKIKQDDGTYTTASATGHRFSFNGVIEERIQGLEVITHMAAVMRAYPLWSGGQLSFIQDRPIVSPARPVGLSNVSEAGFEYQGIPRRFRNSVVKVSWNNPDLFGALDTVELVDEEAVEAYGYNEVDFAAFGCTDRAEAIRRGKYVLDTDINYGETVSFLGGLEWADALPGDLISVQDPNYAAKMLEGRVISGDLNSLSLDRELEFDDAATYTMLLQTAESDAVERVLTNAPGITNQLTWDTPLEATPFQGAQLVISASNLATRKFVIISVSEEDNGFAVAGLEYDEYKYDRIDYGIVNEIPVNTTLLSSTLQPPTDLTAEPYTYTVGDQALRLFGIQLGWSKPNDPRVLEYELRYRPSSGGYQFLGKTSDTSFDWKPVTGDVYDIGVRSVGIMPPSAWVTLTDFALDTALTNLAPPTDLDTKEGDGVWSGKDCTVTWTPSTGSQYQSSYSDDVGDSNVSYYKVDVMKPDTTLLRSFTTAKGATEYTYFYSSNVQDHDGTPSRSLLFHVYSVDVFGQSSTLYASLAASNPAPDMSGSTPTITDKYGYLRVAWTPSPDNDISHYKVYIDSVNPPVTLYSTILHPESTKDVQGLDYDTDYYAQIEPYDAFGVGVKSVVSAPGSTLKIPAINVDVELQGSIVMSDSDGNPPEVLGVLYDGHITSDGLTYTLTGVAKYIQYTYGMEDYFDRVAIWTEDANAQVYFATSVDGVSWTYFRARTDHALTDDSELLNATNKTIAATNYWQLAAGKNVAMLPNNVVAKYARLYLVGTYTTTLYEFVPSRILISELAAIKHLSTYSADLGVITAGVARSSDYVAGSEGMQIDFDDKTVEINSGGASVFTYRDGTLSLYDVDAAELSDPASLINAGTTQISGTKITTPSLSTISANIGTATAGRVQSSNNMRFVNLNATGTQLFLCCRDDVGNYKMYVRADGDAYFDGTLAAETIKTDNIVASNVTEISSWDVQTDVLISSFAPTIVVQVAINAVAGGVVSGWFEAPIQTSSPGDDYLEDYYIFCSNGATFRDLKFFHSPGKGTFTYYYYIKRTLDSGAYQTFKPGKALLVSYKR